MTGTFLLILCALAVVTYVVGSRRAYALAGDRISSLHSRPAYHGLYMTIWAVVPGVLLVSAGGCV